MKKRTISIAVRRMNVIYRRDGALMEQEYVLPKYLSYAECVRHVEQNLWPAKVEAMTVKDLGVRKYEIEECELMKLLEEVCQNE